MSDSPPTWVRDQVFYQVLPDRLAHSGRVASPGQLEDWDAPPTLYGFKGGDLYGVVEHFDRLVELGVSGIYLNPVFTSASNHRYHTYDYLRVDPLLGGDRALRELLDQAHARDLRVVLDGVFNHCGRGFWPFHHVAENGADSPYLDWFYTSDAVRDGVRSLTPYPSEDQRERMSQLAREGRPTGSISREVLGYESWWDLPALPRLDLDRPGPRQYMLEVAEHWLRFGIDGWRLDVAEEVGADFWREFCERVRAVKPDAYLVAEIWHPRPDWIGGDMFDAFMNYPLLAAILGFTVGSRSDVPEGTPAELREAIRPLDAAAFWLRLRQAADAIGPSSAAAQLNLLGSHDTPRLRTMAGGDLDAVRLATLLQMTLPGAPCIYYGDEIGLEGGMDPFCRGGFPRDSTMWQQEPYPWLADLISLRRSSRALRDGELELLSAERGGLAYLRRWGDDLFVVVVQTSEEGLSVDVPMPDHASRASVVPLASPRASDVSVSVEAGRLSVQLPARSGAVVRLS